MQFAITLTMLPTIPLSTSGHMIICKEEEKGLWLLCKSFRRCKGPHQTCAQQLSQPKSNLPVGFPAWKMSVLEVNPWHWEVGREGHQADGCGLACPLGSELLWGTRAAVRIN